jgi:hypothetical protein
VPALSQTDQCNFEGADMPVTGARYPFQRDTQMTELIDYAAPMMRIERLLKDLHDLLLDGKFDEAIELSPVITTESKLLQNTLVLMKENKR